MENTISIIIPVYNSATYIERCLHTLFSQTYYNLEFIFVDDGSEDSSVNVIKKVLAQYPERKDQVKIFSHKYNKGVSQARMTGILKARGDYLIHCDPDDYVEKNWCELLLNKALEQEAEIVICPYFIEKGKKSDIKYPEIKKDGIECTLNIFNNVTWRPLWNKLILSSLIKENNIYPFEDIDFGEDWSLVIRCLNFAKKIVDVRIPLYHYCIRDNSLSNKYSKDAFLETNDVFVKTYEFLDSCGNPRYERLSDYLKFLVKMRMRTAFKDNILDWYEYNKECHKSIMTFKDHTFFNRIYLSVLLNNKLFYKYLMNFKRIKQTIFK